MQTKYLEPDHPALDDVCVWLLASEQLVTRMMDSECQEVFEAYANELERRGYDVRATIENYNTRYVA